MTDTKPTEPRCGTWKRRPERGQAIVEFSLCFLLFLSIMIAIFNFGWLLFTKATLNQAVQAGVRFAITGPDGGTAGQDAIIKDVVKEHSIGLMEAKTGTRPGHRRVQSVLPAFLIDHDSDLQLRMAVVHQGDS